MGFSLAVCRATPPANGGFIVTLVDANHFSLNGSTGNGNYLGGGNWQKDSPIKNASGTAGNPVIITTTVNHQLATGNQVFVNTLTGTYAALNNSDYYITVIDATHFSLNGTVSNGTTAAGGFYGPSNAVLLKSAIGAANLSGLNAADLAFANSGGFNLQPYFLNTVDPRQMLLGFNGVYEDADTTAANGFAGDVITNITANVGALTGQVTALVYGGQRGGTGFTNVAMVGTVTGQLFFRGEAGAAFANVTAALGSANPIDSIAVDTLDWRKVYVVTGNQVFFTADITNLGVNPFKVIGGGPNDNLASLSAGLGSLATELRALPWSVPRRWSVVWAAFIACSHHRRAPIQTAPGLNTALGCPMLLFTTCSTTPRTTCSWPALWGVGTGRSLMPAPRSRPTA